MKLTLDHVFFSEEKQLRKFCNPLLSTMPFSYFGFERYYFDGTCIYLGFAAEFAAQIYNSNLFPKLEDLHSNMPHYVFLSSSLPLTEVISHQENFVKNINVGLNYDIHHRLCLTFKTKEYLEVFIFGMENHKNAFEIFMNSSSMLEKFCIYFRETAKHLIDECNKNRFLFDRVSEPQFFKDIRFKSSIDYHDFFKLFSIKKYPICRQHDTSYLSKREFECLLWSAKNKTAKQIARLLSLSPRTVEDYLINIKNKLNCGSKLELIDMASKDPLIKSFID